MYVIPVEEKMKTNAVVQVIETSLKLFILRLYSSLGVTIIENHSMRCLIVSYLLYCCRLCRTIKLCREN